MRDTPFSNCEKEFILQGISQRKRLDGRECYDYRQTCITFGIDRGCCQVEIGKTRVLAQISCEMTAPKQTKPTEGVLFLNVELSPMAAPQFEQGRPSELSTELTRILERCIRESRCVDTESLCVMAGVKVWTIRCDLHVLNHEGSLVDCASIAALAALAHFRRPDVTVEGEEVTVHSTADRDPVPLSVHHMPLCVTIAFFEQGRLVLVDPSSEEEKVMDGKMVIGMNKHRELCTLQLTGSMLLAHEQVLRCSNIAVVKVTEMTELIQKALDNDAKARAAGEQFGFAVSVETKKITVSEAGSGTAVDMSGEHAESSSEEEEGEVAEQPTPTPVSILGAGAGSIGLGGESTWQDDEADEDMVEELLQDAATDTASHMQKKLQLNVTMPTEESSSDSEEEGFLTLSAADIGMSNKHKSKHKEAASDFDTLLQINMSASSKAMNEAEDHINAGQMAGAVRVLTAALQQIKTSSIGSDPRCRVLVASLQEEIGDVMSKIHGADTQDSNTPASTIDLSKAVKKTSTKSDDTVKKK